LITVAGVVIVDVCRQGVQCVCSNATIVVVAAKRWLVEVLTIEVINHPADAFLQPRGCKKVAPKSWHSKGVQDRKKGRLVSVASGKCVCWVVAQKGC